MQGEDGFTTVPPPRWQRRRGAPNPAIPTASAPPAVQGAATAGTGPGPARDDHGGDGTDSALGTCTTDVAGGQSEDESDTPPEGLHQRFMAERDAAKAAKQRGAGPEFVKTLEEKARATYNKWQRARPPTRGSNKLRRAEDSHAKACRAHEAAGRELAEFERRVLHEREALEQRSASALERKSKAARRLAQVQREVGGAADCPPPEVVALATASGAAARDAHDALEGFVGPELSSLLELAGGNAELHTRMAAVVSELSHVADKLGAAVASQAARAPCSYDIADGDDAMSEDELSSVGTDEGTVPEPEDLAPPQPPTPIAQQLHTGSSGGGMGDSTKRDMPSDGPTAHWSPTGSGTHGQRAWRRGAAAGPEDEGGAPPPSRRRTEGADEDIAEQQRQHINELRTLAAVNGAVLPADIESLTSAQLQQWASANLPAAPLQ